MLCFRALPPALLFWCMLPLRCMAWPALAFPVVRHLQAFLVLKAGVTGRAPPLTMAITTVASHMALTADGWTGLYCMVATVAAGLLLPLVLAPFWNLLGPYLWAVLGTEDLEQRRTR